MEGTSINSLQEMAHSDYNSGQNLQFEQGHNAAHQMHQIQHEPYYNNHGKPRFVKQDLSDIEELAKDLNENLPEQIIMNDNAEESKEKFNITSYIPEGLKDPLIILVLFVLLSQPVVRETIGTYIKQINPDMEGKVSLTGIIIYGIILVVLYYLVKRFLL